ncbi:glycosyltransferase [Ensifer sp. ENS10]|uniref:glycosyltransferase n=1 Tax=Ensifer sp. ENS10 TaxID=2769286 RepID=UPI0017876611|nr:glycosyltransferase [Ensifer sp. ENS10]MBD9511393.1 glycosyltransferase [Ensifer sp. ENS10]
MLVKSLREKLRSLRAFAKFHLGLKAGKFGFDPDFYRSYYADLNSLEFNIDLLKHFLQHGIAEGRFPNFHALRIAVETTYGRLPAEFDLDAYKILNPDLARVLPTDGHYLIHFCQFGRLEERPHRFGSKLSDGWESLFNPSQFLAWIGTQRGEQVQDFGEAVRLFRAVSAQGIIAPLSFRNAFEPDFYRAYYEQPEPCSDVELYREWLTTGFSRARAPSEQALLRELLGEGSYPQSFDWKAYVSATSGVRAHRADALIHYFSHAQLNLADARRFLTDASPDLFLRIGEYRIRRNDLTGAQQAFEVVLSTQPELSEAWYQLGITKARMGQTDGALECFTSAIANGSSRMEAYVNAVEGHCQRGSFDCALALVEEMQSRYRSEHGFFACVDRLADMYFAHTSKQTMNLLVAATSQEELATAGVESDRLLKECLESIDRLFGAVHTDSLPAHWVSDPDGHIVLFANHDLRQCTHYRIEQRVEQIEACGLKCVILRHTEPEKIAASLLGARAVVFYRVAAFPAVIKAIRLSQALGVRTFYEIDDLLFDSSYYPDSLDSYGGQITWEEYCGLRHGVPLFRFALELCSEGIASTRALAHAMQEATQKACHVVRNGLDSRNQAFIEEASSRHLSRKRIKIFYGSGTKAHTGDFADQVGVALKTLMETHSNVDLVLVGFVELPQDLACFSDRIMHLGFVNSTDVYWSILSECDINLAVLSKTKAADCKSEIKWLEAAMLKIPSVVSDVCAYREELQPGKDVLIASSLHDWLAQLERLISDTSQRLRIGENAYDTALSHYSLPALSQAVLKIFAGTGRLPMKRKKRRILICNVFYAPQSIGGATRVVEDNIRDILNDSDEFEFVVFASDEGGTRPGEVRFESMSGVLIVRLTCPQERDMDLRAFNPDHRGVFNAVIDAVKPDMIHFHCIQRLTATIVEVADERNIPFIVTLHDAWWISDHQFLVDKYGFLHLPTGDRLKDAVLHGRGADAFVRQSQLAALLSRARARISVSEPFAEIYKAALIDDVSVIENGVSDLPRCDPRSRNSAVHLGHIGGRSAHKGADLVEAVLRKSNFARLRLTMVDGNLRYGECWETKWGETPVRIIGPYPQSEVKGLYHDLDVLLAPSTWPESFGLVSREAENMGLWVVASKLGAISQNISHGENGFVVDVSSDRHLSQVLSEMNDNVQRYTAPPTTRPLSVRTAQQQAKEIAATYRRVLDA